MQLNSQNYFSKEAMQKYMSVSQYKDFAGSMGMVGCEHRALAKLRGDWEMTMTLPLLIGSYVDSHFEGTLDVWSAQHPEIFKKDGGLKSQYEHANSFIARIERDPYFMKFASGSTQDIFTGEIFGVEWKCKVDFYQPKVHITDLKIMQEIRKRFWVKDYGNMSFVHYWGYDIQGAIYQKLVEVNTGELLPFFIAGASKEKEPDIEIIGFTQKDLDDTKSIVENNVQRIIKLKSGDINPDRCGVCDYCKHTKVLSKPVHFSELIKL